MPERRDFARFAILWVILYGLMLFPWPGVGDAYASLYRAGLRGLFEASGPHRSVRVLALGPDDTATAPEWRADTGLLLNFVPKGGGAPALNPVLRSSHYTGYAPTVLTLALILATPLPWRRRTLAALLGLALANVFVAAMAGLQPAAWFVEQQALADGAGGSGASQAFRVALRGLDEAGAWMGPYYVVPVFLWMLSVFQRDTWPPWRRGVAGSKERNTSKMPSTDATH